jgi:uncharacterized membrane protein YkvA (DUF1232 family)
MPDERANQPGPVPSSELGPADGLPEPASAREAAPAIDDPFPSARFGALVGRLPRYLRLAWALAGEPSLPRSRRAGVLGAAAYLASPVDLIPGIVPVVGQLDDVAIVILALRAALRALDEPTRARILERSGLGRDDLDTDLATLGLSASWMVRRGIRVGRRLGWLAVVATVATARAGARAGARVAPVVGSAAATGLAAGARVAAEGARLGAAAGRRGLSRLRRGAVGLGRAVSDRSGRSGSGSLPPQDR